MWVKIETETVVFCVESQKKLREQHHKMSLIKLWNTTWKLLIKISKTLKIDGSYKPKWSKSEKPG